MEIFENEFIRMWIDDGILYGKYKPRPEIDLKAAQTIVEDRISFVNGRDFPALGYLDDVSNVTKDARDFFSKGDGIKHMKKLGLITPSPITKMLGNFWLQLSKPAVPTRLFTNEQEAIKWLKE